MDRLTANRYISLQQKIVAGGSVPQELLDEVAALDLTVNGDSTTTPETPGLVDDVDDLETAVESLDLTVNGDSTTVPPTLGLKDYVNNISGRVIGTVTADGVKTYSALLDELQPYIASAGISDAYGISLMVGTYTMYGGTNTRFGVTFLDGTGKFNFYGAAVNANGSIFSSATISAGVITQTDLSSTVPTSGTTLKVISQLKGGN